MGKRQRLSSEERRASILKAVRGAFAEGGLRGTTTRTLAQAAGVSEALLFQHFSNKEELFSAVQASFSRELDSAQLATLLALEPSTATLVRIVQEFYAALIDPKSPAEKAQFSDLARLMYRSLTEDGGFARSFLRQVPARLVARLEECIKAASASGDLDASASAGRLSAWFTHHLAVTLMLYQLPAPPAVDYRASGATLVREATQFALRGIGLKEQAIRQHFRPRKPTSSRT
jgi:AcrR family transcriptional regulator